MEAIMRPIGAIRLEGQRAYVDVLPQYLPALRGLEEYSHLHLLWWFDGCDTPDSRATLQVNTPHPGSPENLGVFATRSPYRPNPIALDAAAILWVDHRRGRICISRTDARDGTPVMDIKPYARGADCIPEAVGPPWSMQ